MEQGPFQGQHLDPDRLEAMLDGYYQAHGYDTTTGWPTQKRLEELGLEADGRRLIAAGIPLRTAEHETAQKERP